MKTAFFAFLLDIVAMAPCTTMADVEHKVDLELARKLTAKANIHARSHNPNDYYAFDDGDNPDFIELQYGVDDTGYGFFAVNKWTGDVWDISGCRKINTPASDRLLDDIRKRFTSDEAKQYHQLGGLRPTCIPD